MREIAVSVPSTVFTIILFNNTDTFRYRKRFTFCFFDRGIIFLFTPAIVALSLSWAFCFKNLSAVYTFSFFKHFTHLLIEPLGYSPLGRTCFFIFVSIHQNSYIPMSVVIVKSRKTADKSITWITIFPVLLVLFSGSGEFFNATA